jgi:hypothetical protein
MRLTGQAVVTALLAVAIVLGSLLMWVGVPVLGFWLAGETTTSATGFLFAVTAGVPFAMLTFGFLLYRLNAIYERFSGGPRPGAPRRSAWLVASSDERAKMRRAREPRPLIDVAMTASAIAALVLLITWFFFLAEMHLAPMQ